MILKKLLTLKTDEKKEETETKKDTSKSSSYKQVTQKGVNGVKEITIFRDSSLYVYFLSVYSSFFSFRSVGNVRIYCFIFTGRRKILRIFFYLLFIYSKKIEFPIFDCLLNIVWNLNLSKK